MSIALIQAKLKQVFSLLECLVPVWWTVVRLQIAYVFFASGLTKIEDFEVTLFLFENEYAVPYISPYFAALSATFFELVCPVLLVAGVGTRFAVLPLLVMTAVIQFTYKEHVEHLYWAILLSGLLLQGAGKWSLDHWLKKKIIKK